MILIKVKGRMPNCIWVDCFDDDLPYDEQADALPPWCWIEPDDPEYVDRVSRAWKKGCTVLVPDPAGVPLSELNLPRNP